MIHAIRVLAFCVGLSWRRYEYGEIGSIRTGWDILSFLHKAFVSSAVMTVWKAYFGRPSILLSPIQYSSHGAAAAATASVVTNDPSAIKSRCLTIVQLLKPRASITRDL